MTDQSSADLHFLQLFALYPERLIQEHSIVQGFRSVKGKKETREAILEQLKRLARERQLIYHERENCYTLSKQIRKSLTEEADLVTAEEAIEMAKVLQDMGYGYLTQNEHAVALSYLIAAMPELERVSPEEDESLAMLYAQVALAYANLSVFDLATEYIDKANAICAVLFEGEDPTKDDIADISAEIKTLMA